MRCALFLIFGIGVSETPLATPFLRCEACGNQAPHRLTKQSRRFSLFFIPLFSVGSKYFDICTSCGRTLEVGREQAEMVAGQVGPDLR